MSLNMKMSAKHEAYLASLFGGRRTKGSGNQWQNTLDGRQAPRRQEPAFGWDGKATLAKSIGVSRAMWEKAVAQTEGTVRPMLALRFYDNESLDVHLDLVIMKAVDAAELMEMASQYD